jgi:hypothetical protein
MYSITANITISSFYKYSLTNKCRRVTIKEFVIFILILKLYVFKNNNIELVVGLPDYKTSNFKVLRAPYKNKNA